MAEVKKVYRFFWVSAWYAFAAVVVLLATIFAAARLLLPYADQYNAEVGERLSGYLGQPVLVRALDAEWHGWGPALVLRDTALLGAAGEHPLLHLDKIRVGFDLLASLRQWQPVFSHITLVGTDLAITRAKDGAISAAGISTTGSEVDQAQQNLSPFIAWVFAQGRLGIEKSNIIWRDKMGAGRTLKFSAVNVSLRNDGDRHQLDATVTLPRSLGKSLVLRVDMHGDPLHAKGRRTLVYLAGEYVHLAELFADQPLAGVNFSVNNASFQLWAHWQSGELQDIKGSVDAGGLALTPVVKTAEVKKVPVALDRAAGNFVWQKLVDGWQFDGDKLVLAHHSRKWQPSRMSLKFARSADQQIQLAASASFLQLEDVSHLLSLFSVGNAETQKALLAIAPRGKIRNATLNWRGGDTPQYTAYATLGDASVNAWRYVPAAEGVDGQLWLDNQTGQVHLTHAAVVLDFPSLFRWPLQVNKLRGNVAWTQDGPHWRIAGRELEAANEDISAAASLDVVRDDEQQSPFMSLVVDFRDGDGSQVARYLPTGIMPIAAVNWLDEAIVGARVVAGGALFHGRLANFPFDRGDGQFEVKFSAENASLNYAENWPPITGINADVRFLGRSLSVVAHKGKIFSNDIQWANVQIDDMTSKPFLLKIDGEVQGSTQEKLDYLVSSPPLYKSFAQHLEGMQASGESLLNLDLMIPIGSKDPAKAKGWVTMKDNTLSIPALGQVLNHIDGRLNFFEGGLQAEKIQTELFGQPTEINIATDESAFSPKVRIRAKGLFDAPDLAARYLPPIKDLLSGNGVWDVTFDIPVGGKSSTGSNGQKHLAQARQPVAVLQARSNLKGIEARLPPPFDKGLDDAGSLELRVDFPPKQSPVLRVNYAGFVDAIFALGAVKDVDGFRGEVRLNAGAAEMPTKPGLRVTGWLDTVSLDDWRNLLPTDEGVAANGNESLLLDSADIASRKMIAYGQELHNVRFKLSTMETSLQAEVDSKELQGKFTIPKDVRSHPVQADLQHCYLVEPAGGGMSSDPRHIPALDFRVADFRYKESNFGALRLETSRVADGVRIEQLVLTPRSTTITARGGWFVRGENQQSEAQVHVESKNIGHTLKALGYAGSVEGGNGVADLEITWPSAFSEVSAENIKGAMKMSLRDGHLLDVDPGAGRMFGMLSIQTLPRRLLLDFSDVFKKGFGFDRIKGDFTIEDGDAYTNDLYMDGPAARVDVVGRTGLADQDYDQLVTVTPHVADTLPMLGVLTATPQVGAVILGIQKLFQPQIDDATRNQYTITGPWDAPKIKKLKATKAKTKNVTESEP